MTYGVEKSLEFATQHTQFVPPYLDVEELKKDFALAMQLRKILNVLEPLTERVKDSFIAVGADAFTAARVFYHSVKKAKDLNVPGADAIADELGKRYSQGSLFFASGGQGSSFRENRPLDPHKSFYFNKFTAAGV